MPNYILRIANDEWIKTVYDNRVYYTSIRRRFDSNTNILFANKVYSGDSLIGYGIIDYVLELEDLDDRERKFCLMNNWLRKIVFKNIIKFESPLAIKDTELANWPQKGALLHGAPISDEQLRYIIDLSKIKIIY